MFGHTSKHHHVLEVALDLVPPAQVEEEGQRIDIQSSTNKYGNLTGGSSGSLQHNKSDHKSRPLWKSGLLMI